MTHLIEPASIGSKWPVALNGALQQLYREFPMARRRPVPGVSTVSGMEQYGVYRYASYLYDKGYTGQRFRTLLKQAFPNARQYAIDSVQQKVLDQRALVRNLNRSDSTTNIPRGCIFTDPNQLPSVEYTVRVTYRTADGSLEDIPYLKIAGQPGDTLGDVITRARGQLRDITRRGRRRKSESPLFYIPPDKLDADIQLLSISCK